MSQVLPVHSPLLEQSQLLALPPLSDMLKFGGSFSVHQVTNDMRHTLSLLSLSLVLVPPSPPLPVEGAVGGRHHSTRAGSEALSLTTTL
jgi:hypothetical protein